MVSNCERAGSAIQGKTEVLKDCYKDRFRMSNEELFASGDMEGLYMRNRSLIFYIANKFSNMQLDEDDFLSCGDMAFTKAVKNYDPEKSRWISFFYRIMTNEILMENRLRAKQIKTISLSGSIRTKEDKNLEYENVIVSSRNTMDEAVNLIYMEKCFEKIRCLPKKKCRILKLHFKGHNNREIGNKLNVSKSYVGKVVRETMGRLRDDYKKEVQEFF